jgi:hypothetical protein
LGELAENAIEARGNSLVIGRKEPPQLAPDRRRQRKRLDLERTRPLSLAAAMNGEEERRRLHIAWVVVSLVALVQRSALFLAHRADLDAYIDANATWYTYQNLPREMLRDHLLRSLLYLQQTPPASNIVMSFALKWFSWPAGCAYLLIWLQTVVDVLGAVVLMHVLALLYPGRMLLWATIGLLFLLNTDLVVLEYNSMGQTIYGPLAMLLLLVMLDRLLVLRCHGRVGDATGAGLAMGLLVLTRATWSFFSPVCVALTAVLAPRRRARAALACLLPILVLQGGWALKNWAVYGLFSLTTTTWGGLHVEAGLKNGGLWNDFVEFERQHVTVERGYPLWKVLSVEGDPRAGWEFPQEIRDRDQEILRATDMANPMHNMLIWRVTWAEDQRAFFAFVWAYPGKMLHKWWLAYHVFWQPIANYGQQFVDLFAVGNHLLDSFDLLGIARQLRAGTLPDVQYVTSGAFGSPFAHGASLKRAPTSLFTIRWTEPFLLVLNLIGIHLLLPLVGVLWVAGRLGLSPVATTRFDPLRMTALLLAAGFYAYLAGLANLVETHENMRYRQEVEPFIWLVTLICVGELAKVVGWRRRRGERAIEPHVARS